MTDSCNKNTKVYVTKKAYIYPTEEKFPQALKDLYNVDYVKAKVSASQGHCGPVLSIEWEMWEEE